MGQKKGQTGNPNGRPRGVPNKITGSVRQWIADFINGHREDFERDFAEMEASERVRIMTNLLQFVTPKLQSISASDLLDEEFKRLEDLMMSAPEEFIDEITNRLNRLRNEQGRES